MENNNDQKFTFRFLAVDKNDNLVAREPPRNTSAYTRDELQRVGCEFLVLVIDAHVTDGVGGDNPMILNVRVPLEHVPALATCFHFINVCIKSPKEIDDILTYRLPAEFYKNVDVIQQAMSPADFFSCNNIMWDAHFMLISLSRFFLFEKWRKFLLQKIVFFINDMKNPIEINKTFCIKKDTPIAKTLKRYIIESE